MTSILKVKQEDYKLLATLGKQTFIESHGPSAAPEAINEYANKNFNEKIIKQELADSENIHHIICYDNQPAGYSKIILNAKHSNIPLDAVTKLHRIFLLKEFYSLKLGFELFTFIVELSKNSGQQGMWLFVWTENKRAVEFYIKLNFKIIGSHDFPITKIHSNPNHQMFLKY